MKRALVLLVITVLVCACDQVDALGGALRDEPEYTEPPENRLQAHHLWNVYSSNPIEYRVKYMGNPIRVWGQVFKLDGSKVYLRTVDGTKPAYGLFERFVILHDLDDESLSLMGSSDKVTALCIVGETKESYNRVNRSYPHIYLNLHDCIHPSEAAYNQTEE